MSQTTVDKKKHAFRRRVNMTAVTPTAVKGYGGQIATHVDELMRQMSERASSKTDDQGWGPPEDVSKSFAYCIADIMGCLTFGQSWNTQKSEKYRKTIEDGPLGVTGMVFVCLPESSHECLHNLHANFSCLAGTQARSRPLESP